MTSEVWVRNPTGCIREVMAAGVSKLAFDPGYLGKRHVDPFSFMLTHFGETKPYEFLLIRDNGTAHYNNQNRDPDKPIGVYPTWNASIDSVGFLEEWAANPLGENEELCNDERITRDARPIFGQDHRIIVHNIPDIKTQMGKAALQVVRDIQQDYPGVKFFIHGLYAVMPLINMRFAAFDIEPREDALHGRVVLPSGRKVDIKKEVHRHKKWINTVGFSPAELHDPKNRCIFNVKSAIWASRHGGTPAVFAHVNDPDFRPDITVPALKFKPRTVVQRMSNLNRGDGDKFECDTCSLADKCGYYRQGSICTLPGSNMSELASMFETTDTATILKGMARLTAMSAERAERAVRDEEDFGLDPEATKILKQTFDFAERYAKLNDPALRATVNLNRNQNLPIPGTNPVTVTVEELDSGDLAREAIEYYGSLGIGPGEITSDLMKEFIMNKIKPQEIEGSDLVDAEVVSGG